jgi:HK97 family phage portal protein
MFQYIKSLFSRQPFNSISYKDWSEEWLKINEKNMLALNDQGLITRPAEKSYLVYKCVQIISQNTPQAPLLFLQNGDPVPETHPMMMLFNKPNPYSSKFDFMSTSAMYFALYGTTPWFINKSVRQVTTGKGYPGEIWVLNPTGLKPVVDQQSKELMGWTYGSGSKQVTFDRDEIIIIKNSNPYDPYVGLSPLDAVFTEIQTDLSSSKYQERFFKNGAVPGFVLEVDKDDPSTPDELKKLGRQWDMRHKGEKNAHRTAVLRGGMKMHVMGLSQQEMSYIESRQATRDIILSTFGVPKTLAGFTDGEINRAVADTQKRIFWQETIKPVLLRMQDKINSEILSFSGEIGLKAQFDFTKVQELQREYSDDVEASFRLFQMGFSRNELNTRFNLGFKKDDDSGDNKYVPLNLVDVDSDPYTDQGLQGASIDSQTTKRTDAKSIEKASASRAEAMRRRYLAVQSSQEKLFLPKIRKFFFQQRSKVLKLLYQEKIDRIEGAEILSRIDIVDEENRRIVADITPVMTDTILAGQKMAAENLGDAERDVILAKEVLISKMSRIKTINNTVYNQMKKQIGEGVSNGETLGDIADRIKRVYNMANTRATVIARTETASAISEASMIEYRNSGVPRKQWLTASDDRVRPSCQAAAADGPIPINSPFSNGLKHPDEPNCRCCIVASF